MPVVYLLIIVVVALAGIMRLWMAQRRHKQPLETVDGFWEGLERISPVPAAKQEAPVRVENHNGTRPRRSKRPARPQEPARRRASRGSELDPERRAAAKARLEARRRSQRFSAP